LRFLLDASLPRSAGDAVRTLGHEVLDVRDIGLGSAADELIAKRALDDHLVLLTRDFDFADVRNYPPEGYAGIVVIDLPNQATAAQITRTLQGFIVNADWLELLPGRLAILEAARARFRPAP
jgi:predicted nuclease of predicted toxin-antitoxin system